MATTEGRRAAQRRYRESNRDKRRAASRAYYYANKEKMNDQNRVWRTINQAQRAAQMREYQQSDNGRAVRANIRHLRRRRLKNAGVTAADILKVLSAEKCWICEKRFTKSRPATLDHVVPLACGGLHEVSNLAAAHQSCNLKKGSRAENPKTRQGILV